MNKLILSTLIITAVAAPPLAADNRRQETVMWAKVTNVEPIVRILEKRSPTRDCWDETVPYRPRHEYNHSPAGVILGTIIGGAIGHNVSRNRGAGTVVGAMIGASVGSTLTNQGYARSDGYSQSQRRCQINQTSSYQEKVLGYEVWYRYQGNEYKTQMDHHPGNKIRIRLRAEPY